MTTKQSSIHLASEGSFDTVSTDSLSEMRALVEAYAEDPNGAVLDGWEPREGTIITEVRAISARINQNFDAWPSEELREAHHTFVGKPVFVNHNNHDPDRARGRVVASRYVDAGENDRYVQVLQEVEASRFPLLAKELMEGGLDSVSMGAEAREVECSVCSNISTSPFDACEHIPMKGASLRTANGEETLVYEICRKISFFELSYVFDPADETAVASNVLVANRKTAAISDDVIAQLIATGVNDGFTIKSVPGDEPKTGYQVGIHGKGDQLSKDELTVERVREFLDSRADLLSQPDNYLGGWNGGDTFWLDVSKNVQDFDEAMSMAVRTGEEAIWDNANKKEYFARDYQHLARRQALNEIEAPPKVDTLHPDEDEKSNDDWHEYIDDPNVIDTIDVLDEPDLGLNQELERPDDEVPEGFEEFADVDKQIEENEQAEEELAQESREHAQEKADEEAAAAQEQFEQADPGEPEDKDPEDDENWDEEDDGAGGSTQRFKGGGIEAMVADDYGTFNMWVEKNGSLIASDTYLTVTEAKAAAIEIAKAHRATTKESKMSNAARRKFATGWSSDGFSTKWKSFPGGEAWVATDNVEDAPVQKGGWILYDSSGNVLEQGDEGSPGAAQEAAEQAIQRHSSRKTAAPLDGWDMSFNDAAAIFQERDFQLWVATDDYDDGTENWQLGEWSVYDSTFSEVASGHENSVNSAVWAAIIAAEEQGFDTGSVPASGNTNASRRKVANAADLIEQAADDYEADTGKDIFTSPDFITQYLPAWADAHARNVSFEDLKAAAELEGFGGYTTSRRHNGSTRTSRTNDRDTSRRSNRMAPQRRRRIGDNNKQTPLLEDTGIAQTPASEPVALPEEGDSVPNNSDSDRVKAAREALRREVARERAIRARRRRAKAVGEKNSNPGGGDKVKREDLFEDFPATNMTARLRKRFANWVQANYGCSIREASGPGELRSWARVFSREADVELPRLHAAIKRDVQALKTAADDDDKDDIPDFIEEKIKSDEDNPSEDDVEKAEDKEARRQAVARARRRRAAQQAQRGRRTQTTRRRKTADEKLDVAAPGDRVNVEKPTSGTTDADAEASQFDKADFDNNSGKGLEDPDNTPTPGIPGGPSVNDLGRSSARRASGLQAVKLAEAMIKVGLVEDSSEAKYKAAAEFEKMARGQVLDRTALLEKVAEVQKTQRRSSATKSAGNRGTSLNSAVPSNLSGATRSAAPQRREAATDSDSDLFF